MNRKMKKSFRQQNVSTFMHIGKLIAKKSFGEKEVIVICRNYNFRIAICIAIQIFFFHDYLLTLERITHESFKIRIWKITSPKKGLNNLLLPYSTVFFCLFACFFYFKIRMNMLHTKYFFNP